MAKGNAGRRAITILGIAGSLRRQLLEKLVEWTERLR
jgi:hypothetical protein